MPVGFHHKIDIGPNGETFHPTIKATESCNVEADCKALREAMRGAGTDEQALIDVLGHRTLFDRLRITEKYIAMYGQELREKFKKELSGEFRQIMEMLLMEPSFINARALYKAMKGAGTNELVLIEILCTATNAEIADIKQAYREVLISEGISDTTRTLESDIHKELSGTFKHLVTALLQGHREEIGEDKIKLILEHGVKRVVDMRAVQSDIDELYDAGTGRVGTDEGTFIRIFSTRSVWHLMMMNRRYHEQHGKTLMEAIDSETSGDFRNALKLTLFACLQRPQAYAALLKDAMKGAGTRDSTLMRIIVVRCGIDLGDISRAFEAEVGTSLEQWIRDDTSGHYRQILLTLLGSE